MRILRLTILGILASMAGTSAQKYTLVWSDEFSGGQGQAPNPGKWNYDLGGGGWGNRELQVYTKSRNNVVLDGKGHLVIRAVKTSDGFTSARLKTQEKYEFQFGKVEARIKVPYGQGIWPAFWMLGTDLASAGWPECGEIDIMEHIGREPQVVHSTIHGPGYSGNSGISSMYALASSRRFADDFHIFSVEWGPTSIKFNVDETRYFQVGPQSIPKSSMWVFDHPFFVILNVAVGGEWPGYPDDTSTFPQSMTVDWVRVWKLDLAR